MIFYQKVEIEKITELFFKNDYLKNVYNELNKADNAEWLTVDVKSVLQFSFQLLISLLNNYAIENGKCDFMIGAFFNLI
jgi:hypothetical protein